MAVVLIIIYLYNLYGVILLIGMLKINLIVGL